MTTNTKNLITERQNLFHNNQINQKTIKITPDMVIKELKKLRTSTYH